jgi:hypothetical protein
MSTRQELQIEEVVFKNFRINSAEFPYQLNNSIGIFNGIPLDAL